jgi:GTP-binding protein
MEITQAIYVTSSPGIDKCPPPDKPEMAFIGRSNVGKSSLINMVTNHSKLAKISATPGKTQLINHFDIVSTHNKKKDKWFLVDLPGYGFAKVSQSSRRRWEQMIENYLRKRENLVNVFVLVDSRHSPQAIDLAFMSKLGEWEVPFAIVFTKTDKNKPGATARNINAFMQEMQKSWEAPPPFFASSILDKSGREEILDYMEELIRKPGQNTTV